MAAHLGVHSSRTIRMLKSVLPEVTCAQANCLGILVEVSKRRWRRDKCPLGITPQKLHQSFKCCFKLYPESQFHRDVLPWLWVKVQEKGTVAIWQAWLRMWVHPAKLISVPMLPLQLTEKKSLIQHVIHLTVFMLLPVIFSDCLKKLEYTQK